MTVDPTVAGKQPTIVIVGGLSAGPAAAAKARRENEHARILLFEKTADISYATCGIPYAISGVIAERERLQVVAPELLERRFRIELHLEELVTDIDPVAKTVQTINQTYTYDKLIFAAGARPVIPPLATDGDGPAETWQRTANWATVRTLTDLDRIREQIADRKVQRALVLGGGLIGIEVAENLRLVGIETTVVEGAQRILTPWSPHFAHFAQTILERHGVQVLTSTTARAVQVRDERITGVLVEGRDGGQRQIDTDMLILAVGIRPNTELLTRRGAAALPNGALLVDEQMRTNLPDIYAAGDCAAIGNPVTGQPIWLPLGTHSNKGGRTCGHNCAVATPERYPGGYGTAIIKIFDHTLARTGPTLAELAQRTTASAYIHAPATPSYYPDSHDLVLEITYDPVDGRLLAAEAFGPRGVDKRIDVLATAIYAGLKVEDLANLDLAYAPPYSPAKDPVVVAGYVAGNHRRHRCTPLSPTQFWRVLCDGPADTQLIDLRTAAEVHEVGRIAGSRHIPLDELRDRLGELDRQRPVLVYCAKGIRGYLGAVILRQHGFENVRNLAGGIKAWTMQGYPVER
jgi:NADPH-dependent 2,4-dienoyl-CoA reductase/sulfur reductase-like enzyme/rhodanese-related sulfurtransferase